MRKYFIIALVLFVFTQNVYTQYNPEQKIDSLKKKLLFLRDTAKVDCLNELSYAYTFMSKQDSAKYYAIMAYTEADKHTYIHGIAEAISRKAGIVQHFENDFFKEEKLAREALQWFDKTSDKRNIAILYNQLAFARFTQSFYEEAIGYLEKEYECYKKAGDEYGMGQSIEFIAAIYVEKGDYVKGFDFAQQNLQLALKSRDLVWIKGALNGIGTLCLRIEDYPEALHYYREALEKVTGKDSIFQGKGEYNTWGQMEFAEIYTHLHQYDSALYRYNLFDSAKAEEKDLRIFLVSKGEYYLATKKYNAALHNFLDGLYYHKKLKDTNEIMRTLLDIGKTNAALQNNILALKYSKDGLNIALKTNARQFIRDGYEILYSVYSNLHQPDSAFFYYRQYITMKDIVANDQVKGKFATFNYEQKITILNQEKQLQQAKLNKEQFHKRILFTGILVLLLLSSMIYRNVFLKKKNESHLRKITENELQLQKLESEQKQKEFQLKATELEMQALRSQMNPHFIFNCLSSINRFILKNESEAASDYLTKFSRLIRLVLTSSKRELVTLNDELEMLRLYLEMERLRFKYSFDYNISLRNDIDSENIYIPPLLLQPFAENAVWHGLMNKEGHGHLTVLLSTENNLLICVIEDNGVGCKRAAELKSKSVEKKKSLGLQITKERLALLNQNSEENTFFELHDLYDDAGIANGTKVILKIKLIEKPEQYSLIS